MLKRFCHRIAWIAFFFTLCVVVSAFATDLGALRETTTDLLGIYQRTPVEQMRRVLDDGARAVDLVNLGTFFVVWVPPDYAAQERKRVLVVLHGSEGSAYAGVDAELEYAKKHRYILLSVQWWLGEPEAYLPALETYAVIELALRYASEAYSADPRRSALVAFSRGSAQSFEITYWDRALGNGYFALTIAHSGGIPIDHPPAFTQRLLAGDFGSAPLTGARFFLYCGMKDEEWGIAQCEQMGNAERIVTAYGGIIERLIVDPEGSHQGYRRNPAWHEAGIEAFLRLTVD